MRPHVSLSNLSTRQLIRQRSTTICQSKKRVRRSFKEIIFTKHRIPNSPNNLTERLMIRGFTSLAIGISRFNILVHRLGAYKLCYTAPGSIPSEFPERLSEFRDNPGGTRYLAGWSVPGEG